MTGCSNHYCYLTGYRNGLGTNSTCNCLGELPLNKRIAVQRRINTLEQALKSLIKITEEHHTSPHDIRIAEKYNAVKTKVLELYGEKDW